MFSLPNFLQLIAFCFLDTFLFTLRFYVLFLYRSFLCAVYVCVYEKPHAVCVRLFVD